ncbi:MAG: WcaF family extracellular polysaccharide biosynthesis acetyltransferase [Runella sp.]
MEKTYQHSKTDLTRFDNSWYKRPPLWKNILWIVASWALVRPTLVPVGFKCRVLRFFGAKVGKGVMIKPNVNIKYPWLLNIGDYVWIGEGVWIDNLAQVTLASHVCLSQGAMLLTGNHDYTVPTFDLKVGEIHLEEGVWIGAKSVVCPGVRGFSHAVLAVGSVATKHLAPYGIYQGNPAQWVRERKL